MANASQWPAEPCASFSVRDGFGAFLARSLLLLRGELPQAFAQLCRQLASRTVLFEVDGERLALVVSPDRIQIEYAVRDAPVEVVTSQKTILAVIDGELTLMQAVLDDQLILRGTCDDLLAFHDGLMTYAHGAVRAPSFPTLLRQYRPPRRPATETPTISSAPFNQRDDDVA